MIKSNRIKCTIRSRAIVWLAASLAAAGCTPQDEELDPSESASRQSQVAKPVGESASSARVSAESPATDLDGIAYQITGKTTGKFTDLNSAETGLDLNHVWEPPARHRSLIVGTFGCGIAIGDFDNDGWQDVFVARQNDAGRLFRNLSGMKFEDVTQKVGIDPSGMWSVGTTFVDINNDGLLDLYLCGYDCPNRLYINEGGTFTEQAAKYGLNFSGSSIVMTFADYDLDGDLDGYLVTNFQKPKTIIRKPQLIRKPGQPPEVAPEFRERFFLVKNPKGGYQKSKAGQFDHFYRNDNGRFADVTDEIGIGLQPYIGLSATWWDYNSDGWPDLYVANDFKGPDFLYRNNGPDEKGTVTFSDVSRDALPHTPWYSMGSDFADVNNDGRLDYLASDMAGTNHYRDKLSMGSMSGPDSSAWFLNAVDPPQYMRNSLYLNNGTETFGEIAYLAGLAKTDWTWTVKFADFDNDGWQDVFFTNGMTRDLFNSDLKNELTKILAGIRESGKKPFKPGKIAAEFWARQEPYRLENMAFRNTGNLKFKSVGKDWGLDHLGVSMGAAVGDLDNDGDLDIVVSGFEEPVKLYRNDLKTSNSIRLQLVGNQCNRNALGTRVDLRIEGESNLQTRYVSPTRGFMSTSESVVHFGIGDTKEIASVMIHWPGGDVQELENLAPNRMYRIVQPETSKKRAKPTTTNVAFVKIKNGLSKIRHTELSFDDFDRQPLLPNKHSQLGPGLAWGDIDHDGYDDLFIGGAAFSTGRVVENLGNGKFEVVAQDCFDVDKDSEDMGSLFIDVDNDGDLDLYVVSGGVECEPGDATLRDRLYLNDGTGRFEKTNDWLPDIRESGASVVAADFDQDGDLDLVLAGRIVPGAYPESPKSYLLRNTGSSFEDATDELATDLTRVGMVTSAICSDVDGDDWVDLLLATDWGSIRFFKNESGVLKDQTEEAGLAQRLGWYNSICGGDVDNDGDIDFVVGNIGLNTKYKATHEKPELLYYGDFEGLGRKRIVEAKYENGVCLPRRGLSCSSHAMPMVKEKLPTFHKFAISSLDSIYTEEKLDDATRFEVNSLESGIWINESDKAGLKFSFRSLPMLAQASPIFGSQLCDVNGDGNLDLYVVQNFYGPQRETGYMDGGVSLLMYGDGEGGFEPVDTSVSGLAVTGDATSLTIADFNNDGRPDFLVGKNDSALEAFQNQTENGNVFLLRMSEVSEDKNIIGTKVWAEFSNGAEQLHEVRSSQGYLSQSPQVLYIGKGSGTKSLTKIKIRWPDGTRKILDVSANTSNIESN